MYIQTLILCLHSLSKLDIHRIFQWFISRCNSFSESFTVYFVRSDHSFCAWIDCLDRKRRGNVPSTSNGSPSRSPKRKKLSSSSPGYLGRECNPASKYKKKAAILPLEPQQGALRWWEAEDDSTVNYSVADDKKDKAKWTTLDHNGVVFAPEYMAHGVTMLYEGEEVALTPDQEEIATMYAMIIGTHYEEKDVFKRNFFRDFRKLLCDKNQERTFPHIKDLTKCDFSKIVTWYTNKKEVCLFAHNVPWCEVDSC